MMTNEELSQAIAQTDAMLKAAPAPRQAMLEQHLKALLAEQLKRATQSPALAPIFDPYAPPHKTTWKELP